MKQISSDSPSAGLTCNFSVIIPHKNIPALLQRCLDSLPPRADTQIIVVDDASSPDIVDFNHFPGSARADVEVIFTRESGGPGFARNVGLRRARGRWVLFLDADDLYSEAYNRVLDAVKDRPEDMIFFGYRPVMSDDLTKPSGRVEYIRRFLRTWADGNRSETNLRLHSPVVTGKFIRRTMLEEHRIVFNEVRWNEDVVFSVLCGCFARSMDVLDEDLYIVTARVGSLTSDFGLKKGEFTGRLTELLESERIVRKYTGIRHVYDGDINYLMNLLWNGKGRFLFCMTCLKEMVHPRIFFRMARFAVRVLRERVERAFQRNNGSLHERRTA